MSGYCGRKFEMKQLNYDHVIPRAHGGCTTWENVVTSCVPCNSVKADRMPEQARYEAPTQAGEAEESAYFHADAWKTYLYWKSELDQE